MRIEKTSKMVLRVETSVLVLFTRKVWISANFARTTEFGCLESAWSKEQTKDSEETKKTNRAASTITCMYDVSPFSPTNVGLLLTHNFEIFTQPDFYRFLDPNLVMYTQTKKGHF